MKAYLQTYSLGRALRDDFEGSLKKLAEMGYAGVEFAGFYGDKTAAELKAFLDEIGLEAVSGHVGLDLVESSVPYLKEIGAKYVICPMARFNTMEECEKIAAEFNRVGKIAKDAGLQFGYHNHTQEFAQIDGKYLLDIVMELTDPDLVKLQLDVGWATCAGIDVPAYIEKYNGRMCMIHVKETDRVIGVQKPVDFSKFPKDDDGKPILPQSFIDEMKAIAATDCPTGKGIIDWANIKAVADKAGATHYIIEREWDYKGDDIFGCVKEDLEAVKDI
ncbi:MAG: TIM barrel protein [Firmicutes bacterium]|nr:TIM barrel protein [Bacillota bacterium]